MQTFFPYLHAFRGFAILCIVAAHAWSFMIFWTGGLDSEGLKWLFYLTESLFHGGTLYFAFISGLLFNKVLAVKGWKAFYKSKLLNVLLPYLTMTLFLTYLYWNYYLQDASANGTDISYLGSVLKNLYSGTASIHFWYIPVLMVLFLITPLLSFVQRHSSMAMLVIFLMPLVVSRSPFPDFLKIQSFFYFAGAYAGGMLLGQYLEKVHEFTSVHLPLFLFALIGVTCVITLQYTWDYQPGAYFSSRQSLVYIQKALICVLVLNLLKHREAYLPNWLSQLGTYAFAIYFLHVEFIGLIIMNIQPYIQEYRTVDLIAAMGVINLIVGVLGSLLVGFIFKRMLGKHSRKLIGA